MTLTRDFKETVVARVGRDPAFARELLDEATTLLVSGEPETAAAGFKDHSIVADGASDLIGALFGQRGRHARSAVGAGSLPGDAAVEVAMVARLRPGE